MKTEALDTRYGLLWYVVLEQVLQGATTPHAVSKELGLEEDSSNIRTILNDTDFRLAIYEARKRPAETAVKFIQQNLITYARKMHGVAMDDGDKRSQFSALKDLMDRGGMGAQQKLTIGSPAMYRKEIEDLLEDEPEALAPTRPEITE